MANMGEWKYYITRMRIADIASEVNFASEFGAGQSQVDIFGEARQQVLSKITAKNDTTDFLRKDYRFLSSLVVAAIGGKPIFFPLHIDENSAGGFFKDSSIDESFGVLRFDESLKLYALDGQHRLMSIRHVLTSDNIPDGFQDEQMCVIMVLRRDDDDRQDFKVSYRRLFTSLNRHAKTTSKIKNIILDEDNVFAILTRRIISEHDFFKDPNNRESASDIIKMDNNNLSTGSSHFTSLETLYGMTKSLLSTNARVETREWRRIDKASRPDDTDLDKWYQELSNYWDAILVALPFLRQDPKVMREDEDHLFFRPIGQKMMADFIRHILNESFQDSSTETTGKMAEALKPIAKMNWSIQSYPWKRIVSTVRIEDDKETYVMRNDDRDKAMKLALKIAKRMVSEGTPESDEDLHKNWLSLLSPTLNENEGSLWEDEIQSKFKK